MKPLWQTTEWEEFQKALGHPTLRVSDELMVIHPLFFGLGYGYVPRGPEQRNEEFFHDLKRIAEKQHLVFTRMDPEKAISTPGFQHRSSSSVQPETTLILELSLNEEQLLAQMKRKGRYNINLAQKKGVVVKRAKNPDERKEFCHEFYRILRETTERDVFSAHNQHYYQTFLKSLKSSEIFIAWFDGQAISGAICTYQKDRAIYYYGASGNQHREVMAPYLVQWEAILEAKRRGCLTYDFLGIAPEDAAEGHPWKGITEFKKKFGGSIVHYPKPIDIIHRPFWYTLFRVLKRLQKILKK